MKERILTNVEPKDVLKYFEDLTFIPRESGNEKEVSDYLVNFAKEHGFEWSQDDYYNVLMRKPASKGYEDHPGIIIQAHMDMVCEKNRDFEHDFARDPIKFEVDGDKIIARDTSLGADDGIGVAIGLAVMADPELKHPAIEFVCTSDEERGMSGIENFDFSVLKGSRVINLDSDDEGVLVVGCAGGPVVRVELPVSRKAADREKSYFEITLRGLLGGHSGEDIHRGRANANKLMVRVLMAVQRELGFDLAAISGGLKYNAIPRNAEVTIGVDREKEAALRAVVDRYSAIFADEYRVNDPDIELGIAPADAPKEVLDEESKMKILDYMNFSETGIIRMDMDYPQFVESSVSLGVVNIEGDKAVILIMTRSSKDSQYELSFEKIVRLTELLGGEYFVMSNCPAWEYDYQSELKATYERVYEDMFGKKASIMILHAGVEPSEFAKNMDRKMDMISMGPDVRNLHAPGEYFSISSTQRFWESFKKFLEEL
ncbi:MAG TPA: aminoacyl-histidine dipeptidase [Candidatus Copromorpha excrementigallinarum]|uniref:Cytosol non-specific dipeptidase n=1 Tax=Candidatus Allocopromorpha excrementigallinarum TaxID=2840742 RepID=A0A9D1HZF3_9FIRM|nr:aminoacyl-histidine dipeptidase [Candidatus Copromorpha excrementigallinarum]